MRGHHIATFGLQHTLIWVTTILATFVFLSGFLHWWNWCFSLQVYPPQCRTDTGSLFKAYALKKIGLESKVIPRSSYLRRKQYVEWTWCGGWWQWGVKRWDVGLASGSCGVVSRDQVMLGGCDKTLPLSSYFVVICTILHSYTFEFFSILPSFFSTVKNPTQCHG